MTKPAAPSRAIDAITASLDRIDRSDRPEVWISRIDPAVVLEEARRVDAAVAAGHHLPLAGRTVAVKDNIDVAGVPTTAGCPAYAYVPSRSAPAVQRLVDAGAVVVGKTNLDQFATGLTGIRSPYGACRNALFPSYVSGGSSSGSAVAVALGLVDVGLGTDTAGSGRVPAAFNAIVGTKPTRGLISASGIVPACRSLDCVSLLTRSVLEGQEALGVLAGVDATDPWSRRAPAEGSGGPGRPQRPVTASGVGIPQPHQLEAMGPASRTAFSDAVGQLSRLGLNVVELDISAYLAAGQLLYQGAFVAERYTAVGEFIAEHPDQVDPVVRDIILAAADIPAARLADDLTRVQALSQRLSPVWERVDALMLPTTPTLPSLDAVRADPVALNARLGTYTNGCNLLDLCAVAVPAGPRADGLPFGVTFLAPAFHDHLVAGLSARFFGEPTPSGESARHGSGAGLGSGRLRLVVVGAHLSGQPLNGELTRRGATLIGATQTSPDYCLYALDVRPPKPGLVRVDRDGRSIEVEVWELPAGGFGEVTADVAPPLAIGPIELSDGTWVAGFVCQPIGLVDAVDITGFGGWRAYLNGAASR
jgi:allophanate hydrolase